MLISSDIISLFKTVWESYSPIVGPPMENDMVRLRKSILTILYSISIGADAGCPSGFILTDVAYKRSLATSVGFNSMSSAFKSYNPDIAEDATDFVQKKRECKWTATLATQQLIRSCERCCRYFILNAIGDNWVRRLRDPDCFYTRVAPRDLLDLLSTHIGDLERADVVAMFTTMHLWWAEDPLVPEFINRFDDALKKATRASLPITDY